MLRQRIITALILAALVLAAMFLLPTNITAAIITLLMLAGAWEWAAFPGLKHPAARLGIRCLDRRLHRFRVVAGHCVCRAPINC